MLFILERLPQIATLHYTSRGSYSMVVLAKLFGSRKKEGKEAKKREKKREKSKGRDLLAASLVLSCSVFSVGDSTSLFNCN
jgi:hypothetical protein